MINQKVFQHLYSKIFVYLNYLSKIQGLSALLYFQMPSLNISRLHNRIMNIYSILSLLMFQLYHSLYKLLQNPSDFNLIHIQFFFQINIDIPKLVISHNSKIHMRHFFFRHQLLYLLRLTFFKFYFKNSICLDNR